MKHRLQSNRPEALVHQQSHARNPVFILPVAPQLDTYTGICECCCISLSFPSILTNSSGTGTESYVVRVARTALVSASLSFSALLTWTNTAQDLNMCVFTHRAFSCWVFSSFLSHHMDLWKPHVTIFTLFCIFPSEGATDTQFPLLLSLAVTDGAWGHCHLLMLTPAYTDTPSTLPASSVAHCFPLWSSSLNVLCYRSKALIEDLLQKKSPWIIRQNSRCCMWEYITLCEYICDNIDKSS